jgi:hypothetical protein
MIPSRLTARVTLECLAIVVVLSVPAAWLGGGPAAIGVLAGGALAAVNFHALAGGAATVSARLPARGAGAVWLLASGARFAVVLAVCAALFVTGWAHPIAVLVGLTVLPCQLVRQGLRLDRESG